MTDEECPSCKIAVALGMALNVCKKLDGKEECDELFKKVIDEDISPQKLFDLIKEKAKDSKDDLDMLDYIQELAGDLETDGK